MAGFMKLSLKATAFRCVAFILLFCLVYQLTQVQYFTKQAASYQTIISLTDKSKLNTTTNASSDHPEKDLIRISSGAVFNISASTQDPKKNVVRNKTETPGEKNMNDNTVLKIPVPDKEPSKENKSDQNVVAHLQDGKESSDLGNNLHLVESPYKVDADRISQMVKLVNESIMFRVKHAQHYNEPIEELPLQTKGIIILTQNRSGSTFFGEIFNKHPDVFYVFEPLGFFDFGQKRHKDKTDVVRRYLKCDFPDIPSLFKTLDLQHRALKTHCIVGNICFRGHMRNLCGRDMCPIQVKKGCHECGPVHLPRANRMCRKKMMTVVKLVRLRDIMPFKTIAEDPTFDLKIIHLVRDPRGIESSRVKLNKKLDVNKNSMLTCGSHLRNGIAGFANTTETQWLKDRYYRIRYEDLAMDPFMYTEEIYRFAGLEFTPEIGNWIKQNTQQNPAGKNPWTTKRNSSSTMEAWRNHLPLKTISIIQKNCAKVLDMYGYKPVYNESELHDFRFRLVN